MRSVAVLLALGLVLCLAGSATAKVLFIDHFPHFQTFDSWNDCYYDGTCYENRCDKLSAGWYNPYFRAAKPDPPSIRHWWVIDQQSPSNWDLDTRDPVACDQVRTGPCADHTTGIEGKGKYMYAESTACFGITFEVRTPTFLFNNTGASISFWYYLFGEDVDGTASIALDLSVNNGTWRNLWTVAGNKGQQWNYHIHYIQDIIGNNATTSDPTPVTFRFVAVTSSPSDAFYSDLAFDDVYITQDDAPNTSEPYIEPNDTKPLEVPSPVAGGDGGDGLTDAEIAGIVVGIVGGACCLCCLLCLCLLALLLIISPRKPPEEQAQGGL